MQSWAHRSFELSDRSKAMSDPWISERKEKNVERRANCQKKEFADRSKRSLSLKERSAKPHFEQFALERCKVKRVDNPLLETGYMTHKYLVSQRSQDVSWGTTVGTISSNTPLHRNPAPRVFTKFCRYEILYVFFVTYSIQKCRQFCEIILLETLTCKGNG